MLTDEDFLILMEELRVALSETEIERYNYFLASSQDGKECKYTQLSLGVFQKNQERQKISDLLKKICNELT
jgi:hypothetical protein